jgi:hypothetical protein
MNTYKRSRGIHHLVRNLDTNWAEVSGQLHAPAALPKGKKSPPVPITQLKNYILRKPRAHTKALSLIFVA